MTGIGHVVPPAARSAATAGLLRGAASGRFILQRCNSCARIQYPPRDACHGCLGTELVWEDADPRGTLLAITTIHVSNEPYFQARTPWLIGVIASAEGPSFVVHLLPGSAPRDPVVMDLRLDAAGRGVVVARRDSVTAAFGTADIRPREDDFLTDFSNKTLLVTNGCSTLGHFVIASLLRRGVSTVVARCLNKEGVCPQHEDSAKLSWINVTQNGSWTPAKWNLDDESAQTEYDAVFDTSA